MRSEQEIMDLILSLAQSDSRILAVYLKGSRTNPKVPKDRYRDFDIMYVVTETAPFRENPAWLSAFGTILLKQEQDDEFGFGARFGLRGDYRSLYSWLLVFDDGVRIDLGVETVEHMQQGQTRNKLFLPLLDKIGCLPLLPPPSDEDFFVQPPTVRQFQGCCNAFFWSLCDTAKGVARNELPYALSLYHSQARPMLEQMLAWYVGCTTRFSVSCGKEYRFLCRYLPQPLYQRYAQLHAEGSTPLSRPSIQAVCALFREAALFVAKDRGYSYSQQEEDGFFQYLSFLLDAPAP